MTRQSVQEIKAKDIMARNLITVELGEEVSSAIGKMQHHDINEVPVVSADGKIIGLVNYETLLKKRSIPMSAKVENIMAFPPRVGEDDPVMDIAETMLSSGYRAVPVTEKDFIVGMVSRSDLVGIIPELNILREILVCEIMTSNPHFIREKETLDQARNLMFRLDVRALPVINGKDELTGVVGLKDLAKLTSQEKNRQTRGDILGGKSSSSKVEVKSIMKTPVSIGKNARISEAVNLMNQNEISTIIVTEENKPIGIITQYDLIELIASFKHEEQVFVQISGLHEAEPEAYDMMYELIQKSVKRMAKIVTPKVFTIHVHRQDTDGEHAAGNITMSGRMTTEHELFFSTSRDWDLAVALSTMLSQMEKSIRKDKDKKQAIRKETDQAIHKSKRKV
jgi:CBS domain-containing protein